MTPHNAIDDCRFLLRSADGWPNKAEAKAGMQTVIGLLERAAHFHFSNDAPHMAHFDFGADLLKRGLFALPFPEIFITGAGLGKCGILASMGTDGLIWVVFRETEATSQATGKALSIIAPYCGGFMGEREVADWRFQIVNVQRLLEAHAPNDDAVAELQRASSDAFEYVLGAVAMLMSRDTETDLVSPSPRLNRDRAAKGRQTISERRVVRVRMERRAAHRQQIEDDKRLGRSSPRIHWRRGHFRRLHSGSVIPVAPSIVNASPDAKPEPKTYEVTP